jgi:hypothetical protein
MNVPNEIIAWKKYLTTKALYSGPINKDNNLEFKSAIKNLESLLTKHSPSIKGMIWKNNTVNKNVSIVDVNNALNLLSKFAQADLDALGPPDADQRGTIINQMFLSQDMKNSDNWSESNNQNQGREGSTIPKNLNPSGKKITQEIPQKHQNIDDRMKALTDLLENVKK